MESLRILVYIFLLIVFMGCLVEMFKFFEKLVLVRLKILVVLLFFNFLFFIFIL